jgi:beta-lactamase class A
VPGPGGRGADTTDSEDPAAPADPENPADSGGIAGLFSRAGCTGQLCVQSLDGAAEVAVGADRPAVAASVIKICIALEAEAQFAGGQLDPQERFVLPAAARTPGPSGFSLYRDDVEVSLRDLVVAMLTISDNPATDALLHRVGIGAVNATSARLGLAGTIITADLDEIINSIGRDAGFADWAALASWAARPHSQDQRDDLARRVLAVGALDPLRTSRTTARDMTRLLRLIWSDQAGPPAACQRVREVMSRQLTRHRLASAFGPPVRVAAKSGSLAGVVRNEVGVISYRNGRGYAAAVFTRALRPWQGESGIDAAIGAAAAAAITSLTGAPG